MRFFSIITAILVTLALYFVVFERSALIGFATGEDVDPVDPVDPAAREETSKSAPAEPTDDTSRIVSVVAFRSEARNIDSTVLLRGRTEAARQVDVQSETSGLIMSEPLRKGSSVEAGQALCEISAGTRLTALADAQARLSESQARLPEAQGRTLEAEARLREAEINDNAARRLNQDGYATEVRLAETGAGVEAAKAGVQAATAGIAAARAGIETAKAAITAAQKEIDKLEIRAPFGGLLETDTAELGKLMQPGALCATIIQLNPIKLVGYVPETEVSKVMVGAQAGARLTSGREVMGKVLFVSRSADAQTRTFRVEISVPNEDLSISDGQTAEILISAQGQQAHLVPASAMTLDDAGTLGVQVVNGDKAGFRAVTILRDTAEGVWVAGLDAKAGIIIVGQEYVTDGVAIKVSYEERAT